MHTGNPQAPFVNIEHALIACENELQRCYVSRLLQRLGITAVSSVSTTADLLAQVRERPFKLFVISSWLPGTPILQLIDALADSGRGGYIIVSGLSDRRIQHAISEYARLRNGENVRLIFAGEPLRLFDFTDMLCLAGAPSARHREGALPDAVAQRFSAQAILRAYRSGEISMFFQPQYCLATGVLLGAEGLVRWRHHDLGVLGPDHFLPTLEDLGLGQDLIDQLIRAAADISQSLQKTPTPLKLSINIPSAHIVSAAWAETIVQQINAAAGTCAGITIEVTEDSAPGISDSNIAGAVAHWRLNGIDCAIDDFGTGASTLRRLCLAPFNILKIDRRMVWRSRLATHVCRMLEAVVDMAHGLGMRVIAEGIETESDLARMRSMKCDAGQGYYFSRPLPDADFRALAMASSNNAFRQRAPVLSH
ncbi:EAL domain-containing protein [Ralstonia pseudosolanacearum]|uniref:EAL domain-containing protein n=1 Tax=Ralstonia pseudosolanacearum TaxID=1310165 RepID=UPI0018A377B2|nr:EAL domain-containing protein [Ralstonia pseudosolanacearum]BCL95495.1 transcriptional regulator [Ralstonia solanacearum]BCM00560.1 transcriptional regulator [Ralstonia solanacearum]BCM16023.1 transcriptional regulator [Ralstonia solanacearum]BCN08062.1 transcriptional regulator [Ralstonia solanacearum]